MAVYSPKTSSRISRAFPFVILFCCALAVLLPAFYVQASTEIPGITDKICLVPPLNNAIAHYKQIEARGGWPQLPAGPTLREGDRNERIPLLKQRLLVSADLSAPVGEEDFFDEKLTEAVRRFQTRHGLTADGRVGVNTRRELNVPVGKRLEQLSVNIERCIAMPYAPEQRFILVNIADFTLKLFENSNLQLSMSVIVGKKYRQTQEFSGRISSLVLNPSWNVPQSIAVKDLL
ncbi:MAG: peptidoglycan-binding protein, partial [Smithella sp.]